jgi:D-sedoheptulose 7-phosphate isomerase
MSADEIIRQHLDEHLQAVEKLQSQIGFIQGLAVRVVQCLDAGGKILLFGNGGSAADAQHIAAEFVVRYRQNRTALPAIALTTDTSILTAAGNDFGFEHIFARQVSALGAKGDLVIGISTSGTSKNVVAGLQAAKDRGCTTVAFTGEQPGACSAIANLTFHAPSPVTARVQECHLLVGHILCDLVEGIFADRERNAA